MPKRNLIWLVVVLAAALVTVCVMRMSPPPRRAGLPARPGPADRVRRLIRANYYREVSDGQLDRGAIGGMVEALDEFSSYIPPEKVEAFRGRMNGRVCGLGIRLTVDGGRVRVAGPLPGSPAHHAGILPGDRILAVDGRQVGARTLQGLQRLLDGPRGSTVRLQLVRTDGRREVVRLVRDEFTIETVTGLFRGPGGEWVCLADPQASLAYLRIWEFTRDTPAAFERAMRQLGRLTGVVLDLRDNPGGAKPAAIEVADMFLRDGLIVTVVTRGARAQHHMAHGAGTVPHVPVVVLVNAHTASAAELVAGALRARDRAVLVGVRTGGKGCIQSMIRLGGDLGQVNLTTAWFHFGSNEPILRGPGRPTWGIEPHVRVSLSESRRRELERLWARALVLPPRQAAGTRPATAPARDAAGLLKLDSQLARAVQLLKHPEKMSDVLRQAAARRAAAEKARAEKAAAEKAAAEKAAADAARPE